MNAPASTPALDRDTVQRLVAEVIRRIQAEAKAAPAATVQPQAAAAAPASSYGAPEPKATAALTLADRVITLHAVERLPAGTRQVVVDAKAVITPSARDHAKELGIALVRGGTTASAAAAPPRPFLIAHSQCQADPSTKAAAIARAVPAVQQLPPSGLADVIAALAVHASRDAARGILLTSRPAVAAILANRSASLRAVTGRDAASLAAAAADCQANLLVVDPTSFTGSLERLCTDFAARPAAPLPSELASAPTGCGCKTH